MGLRNRKVVRTIQIIFGLLLLFFVLNAFLMFLPAPNFNEAGTAFLGALFNTGYVIYIMQIVFILSAIMFIFDKWSAFGAVLLAPITLNILLFHVFLDITGWYVALVVIALNVYLGAIHWPRYKAMFSK